MKPPIDRMLDAGTWTPLPEPGEAPEGLPHATHAGVLRIGELELPVVQLSDGQRLVTEDGMRLFLAWLEGEQP